MKKIIIIFILLSFCCLGQDLFASKDKNEYLFIGSKEGGTIKLLNIKDHSIVWDDKNLLQQIDRLPPKKFLKEIFKDKMVFSASGDEPFGKQQFQKMELVFLLQIQILSK